MVDVKCLSDYELDKHLKTLGFTPGPILPSTRKMYEKKLVQLLASPPCEPPVMNRLRRLHGSEDSSEDSEDPAVNIILKGNIKFSKNKGKEGKKSLEVSTNKGRILDIYYLSQKPTKKVRHAARPSPRVKRRCVSKEDYYKSNKSSKSSFPYQNPRNYFPCRSPGNSFLCQSPENSVPWSLKLAVLGIFFIVLFVYIIVEKKPLLG
ncbi:LEM domain-containing protein 1 isoform X1 [Grammomys surdaster]|uniref:LEM domain-containing protein 1 isoform X1 n=1 Tax=Grammomys surdaster TaxID=491861 RepID=UPI00109F7522|nr:LEM domain-containing protein 1 isoform X1 [Grammomys surdaster]